MKATCDGLCEKSKEELVAIVRQQRSEIACLQSRLSNTESCFHPGNAKYPLQLHQTETESKHSSHSSDFIDIPLVRPQQRDVLKEYFYLVRCT